MSHRLFWAAVVFLAVAVVLALFGFGVVADAAPLAGKLFSVLFLLAAAGAFGWVWLNRTRQVA